MRSACRVRALVLGAIGVALIAASCTGSSTVGASLVPSVGPPGSPMTYVAVGASETVGFGADAPVRDAWPQVFYRTALPRAAAYVNLGVPGATVGDALTEEVPQVDSLHPDVVTVWLNVDDLLHRVPPDRYGEELARLLSDVRADDGTIVLVANTPPLEELPAYTRCAPSAPGPDGTCDASVRLPPQAVVRAVDAYNRAIDAAARETGAVVVDLHAVGLRAREDGDAAELVSSDGFHPSTAGHRAVAAAFAEAYRAASR